MKKIFTIGLLSISCLGFAQSKDFTKKQAYEAFKNSDIRKSLKVPLSQFNFTFKQIQDNKDYYKSTTLENREKFNIKEPLIKESIVFTNNNSKEFINHVREIYNNWHGNDKEMLLIETEESFIQSFPINK